VNKKANNQGVCNLLEIGYPIMIKLSQQLA